MWGSFSDETLAAFYEAYTDKANMPCNKPHKTPSHPDKKSIVKACENGQEKIVRFGDQHMSIKKHIKARRDSFHARHKCGEKKSKLSAGYWSCKAW